MSKKLHILKPGESLPEGAVQVHLYPVEDVLRPRGDFLAKEGLGSTILERLESEWEHWTDPKYGDNPNQERLRDLITENVLMAVTAALVEFHRRTSL